MAPSLKAAFDLLPLCGVQPDGSCLQCGGSCMWYGQTQAAPADAATGMELPISATVEPPEAFRGLDN